MAEVNVWKENYFPLNRLQGYLEARGVWDKNKEQELVSEIDKDIRTAMKRLDLLLGRVHCTVCGVCCRARGEKKPSLTHLFTDVYDVPPARLLQQQQQMQSILTKYPDHYPTNLHES